PRSKHVLIARTITKQDSGSKPPSTVRSMNSFFPLPDDVYVEDQPLPANEVIDLLRPMIGEKRLQTIERVIQKRCFGIHPILEGLSDRGNISAVLRSAEGLGNGCVHVVETRRRKLRMANRVSQGAE